MFEKDTGRDYPIRLDGDASELADALNNRDLSDVKLIVHDRVGSLDIMMGDSLIEDLIISSRFWRMSTRGDNRDIVLPKDGVVYITITRCAISSTRYNSYLTTAEHIEPPKTSPAEDPRIHVGPVLSDSGALEAMEHIAQAVTEATATARKTPDALSHGVPVIHRFALDRHIEANVRLRSQFIHGHVVGGPAYDYVMELYNQTVAEVSSTLIGLLDTIERSHGELTLAAIHAGGSLSAERIKKIVLLLAVGTELPSVLSLRFKHKEVEYSYDICFTMIDGLKSTADVTSIFVKLHKGGLGHDGVNRETYDLSSWQEVVPSQAPRACVVRVCRNPDQPLPYSDAPLIIDGRNHGHVYLSAAGPMHDNDDLAIRVPSTMSTVPRVLDISLEHPDVNWLVHDLKLQGDGALQRDQRPAPDFSFIRDTLVSVMTSYPDLIGKMMVALLANQAQDVRISMDGWLRSADAIKAFSLLRPYFRLGDQDYLKIKLAHTGGESPLTWRILIGPAKQ